MYFKLYLISVSTFLVWIRVYGNVNVTRASDSSPTGNPDGLWYELLTARLEYLQHTMEQHQQTVAQNVSSIMELLKRLETHQLPPNSSQILPQTVNTSQAMSALPRHGDGWIVVQHRFDGSVDFYRNWTEYRDGFVNPDGGELWLGLEQLHQLTREKPYVLLVELTDFNNITKMARYEEFQIGSEAEGFKLKQVEWYSGTAGDALTSSKNMKFSTHDRDNDAIETNCAIAQRGAWWYRSCGYVNINSKYSREFSFQSNFWYTFESSMRGLMRTRMLIKEN